MSLENGSSKFIPNACPTGYRDSFIPLIGSINVDPARTDDKLCEVRYMNQKNPAWYLHLIRPN